MTISLNSLVEGRISSSDSDYTLIWQVSFLSPLTQSAVLDSFIALMAEQISNYNYLSSSSNPLNKLCSIFPLKYSLYNPFLKNFTRDLKTPLLRLAFFSLMSGYITYPFGGRPIFLLVLEINFLWYFLCILFFSFYYLQGFFFF